MRKIIMLALIVIASSTAAGCACGYSTCTSCAVPTTTCCGSAGWY